ncbi:MAG: hypothetical protein GY753_11925 [Gammaproteobacteria bacterium]|nr:hypothetical protein [Gammaproteobacteria bacterium]
MTYKPIIDPMVVFFEAQGYYLSERQFKFCVLMLEKGNAIVAAKLAGFPNPAASGPSLFSSYADILHQWREHNSYDFNLVRNIYTRQCHASKPEMVNAEAVKANPAIEPEYEHVPDDALQGKGAKGLRDLLGLDKSKELDLNVNTKVGLAPSTMEMLKNAYE